MRIAFSRSASLRVLLTWSLVLAPIAAARAQTPEAPAVNRWLITPDAAAVARINPRQLLTSPRLRLAPIEVAKAAGEKYIGMDPAEIEQAVVIVGRPTGAPSYGVVLQANAAFDLAKLSPELTGHTQPGELAGRDALVSRAPGLPSFVHPKPQMLVVGSTALLEELMSSEREPASTALAERVAGRVAGDDLYAAVDLEAIRPLLMMALAQAQQEAPPEARRFFDAVSLIQTAELMVNVSSDRPTTLIAHTADAADADRLEQLYQDALALARDRTLQALAEDTQFQRMRESDDPVERAVAAYVQRISGSYEEIYQSIVPVQRTGDSFVVLDTSAQENGAGMQIATVGVLVALLLPAVQAAREAARRSQSVNNLKQLMLAMLLYENENRTLPAHANYGTNGAPLLSWRVHMLPYIEQEALYEQFRLDEPWDSPHNRQLVARMPDIFLDPSSSLTPADGKTHYLAASGDGMLMTGADSPRRLADVKDGTSNTISILQVSDEAAVPWTKPEDWRYDPDNPKRGLDGPHPGVFLAAYADGYVTALPQDIDASTLRAMLTVAGREPVNRP